MTFTINVNDSETIRNFFRGYAETATPAAALTRVLEAYHAYNAYREVTGATANELKVTAEILEKVQTLRNEIRAIELRYLDNA